LLFKPALKFIKDLKDTEGIEEETFEGEITESTVRVDPTVNRYVQALARTVKK